MNALYNILFNQQGSKLPYIFPQINNIYQAISSPQWVGVKQRFDKFHQNLTLTSLQSTDALTKINGVISCLNRYYYSTSSSFVNGFMIGSWGKKQR